MATDDMAEEWRPIKGYEGSYEVSSFGRVRSLDRIVRTRSGDRKYHGRVLRPSPSKRYWTIVLSTILSGSKTRLIHDLICETFHGPRPSPKHEVAHGDGNGSNNVFSNLRWSTKRDNENDKIKHNTLRRGALSGGAKLDDDAVINIRRIYSNGGISQRQLAEKFGVTQTTVSRIVRERGWTHL